MTAIALHLAWLQLMRKQVFDVIIVDQVCIRISQIAACVECYRHCLR